MQTKTGLFLISLSLLLVAGCSEMHLRENFGQATKTNRMMQMENSSASKMSVPSPELDGQRAEKVIDEYRKGRSTAPSEVLTQ